MRRRRLVVGVVFVVVALISFASGAAVVVASKRSIRQARAHAASSAARTVTISCNSPSLGGTLPTVVYLPAGYDAGSARYRVIYFLHGLPAGPSSYLTNAFVASALAGARRPAIVVAPQGARDDNSDREYLDWSPSEDWPQAISYDLPRCIDKRYRTVASRYGRALVGLSAGGYGAMNIGLRALSQFGAVESWSGYFEATDPSGDHVLNLGSAKADAAARVPSGTGLRGALVYYPSLIAFYVGDQDSRFLQMNKDYDAQLRSSGVAHTFRIYPGGHSSSLWYSHAPAWLEMALDSLQTEQAEHK